MIRPTTLDPIPRLRRLGPAARQEILATSVTRSYRPGEALWEVGEPARGLFFLLAGRVRVLRPRGDRLLLVHTCEAPGTALGEVPLFTGDGYPARAVAVVPTRCLVVPERALRAAMAADPALAGDLMVGLARRVERLVRRLQALGAGSVRERLVQHLLSHAEVDGAVPVVRYRSHAEMAEDLGTVREVVSREIGRLRREGLLRSPRRGLLEIVDEAGLQALEPDDDR